jgi:hypothetical protein
MRMDEGGDDLGFTLKALYLVARQLGMQHLDGWRLYNSLWKWSEHEQTPSVFSRGVKHDHPKRTD